MQAKRAVLFTGMTCALLAAQSAAAQDTGTTRVAILLFNGVQIIDFTGPYEVFGQAGFDVYTASTGGATITTAMNMSVNVDHDFESAPDADVVLIPGGHVHAAMADPATLEFVTAAAMEADHVVSVCTGSFILGAAGLLDGKRATTFHSSFADMQARFPQVDIVRDRRWVDTGKVVTSAGLSSGIDAALHIVAEIRGIDTARTTAMTLEYDWSPDEREGFIRGLQADQHMRYPSDLTFPEGTEMHAVSSYGNEHQWRSVLHVTTPLDAAAFLSQLRELAERDAALELSSNAASDTAAWRYTDDAGRWELAFSVEAAAASAGLKLVGELRSLD